ncbi:MAG: 1-deoxy-D-xylulose-5-phosphate synthase, partial [Betaproteobacteria bacterium]|nr:1-deoxy-D-xylulose-5-phosphate synthase [Betaproteobacteria bacterium]
MNLLDKINSPKDLKKLKRNELTKVCDEIRTFIIESVSKTGGHLSSNLGVIELTVALHYVFDCPQDKFI